jgi:hypothetical protein
MENLVTNPEDGVGAPGCLIGHMRFFAPFATRRFSQAPLTIQQELDPILAG